MKDEKQMKKDEKKAEIGNSGCSLTDYFLEKI